MAMVMNPGEGSTKFHYSMTGISLNHLSLSLSLSLSCFSTLILLHLPFAIILPSLSSCTQEVKNIYLSLTCFSFSVSLLLLLLT